MTTSGDTHTPDGPGLLARAVAVMARSISDVAMAPTLSVSPVELGAALVEVTRQIARLTSVQLSLVGDAERAQVGSEVGAGTEAWWADQTRVTRPAARSASRLAAALDPDTGTCPVVGAGLAAGRVLEQQAGVIVAALAALPADLDPLVRAQAEQVLVDLAADHDAHELRRLGRAILELVAPDLAEEHEKKRLDEEERRAWEQIRFSMRIDGHGLAHGEFILPAAQGEMLRAMVMAFADARYRRNGHGPATQQPGQDATQPAARTSIEPDPSDAWFSDQQESQDAHQANQDANQDAGQFAGQFAGPDEADSAAADLRAGWMGCGRGTSQGAGSTDPPPPPGAAGARWRDKPSPQRLGEAFADLIERIGRDQLPIHGGRNPTVVVAMTLAQLTGRGDGAHTPVTLDTGSTITAGQARRLACEAGLIPAVHGSASVALDMGRRARYFTAQQRTALALRDHGCTAVGCDMPPSMCDAHHVAGWAMGGETDLANARLLCGHHHRVIHDSNYDHEVGAGGLLRFTRLAAKVRLSG